MSGQELFAIDWSLFCLFLPFCGAIAILLTIFALQQVRKRRGEGTDKSLSIPRGILSWISIITPSLVITWLAALILFAISRIAEEVSTLSSFAIFVFTLSVIPLTIAIITKIYFSIRNISPEKRVLSTSMSQKEIKEGDPAEISVDIRASIPAGYILKLTAEVPEKLGGTIRRVVTKSEGGKIHMTLPVPFTRRGQFSVGPLKLEYEDVLGFSKIVLYDASRFPMTILPQIPYIERFNLFAATTVGFDDEQTVQAMINTEEFYSSRPYVRGDNQKHVHWKLTAKRDEIMVREPESTVVSYQNLSIVIMNLQPKIKEGNNSYTTLLKQKSAAERSLDKQIRIAAAIIDYANRTGIPVSITYCDKFNSVSRFKPDPGDTLGWLRKLATIDLVPPTAALPLLLDSVSKDKSVILTTSETDPGQLQPLIQLMSQNGKHNEIMYCPVSDEMRDKVDHTPPPPLWMKTLTKIFLTNDYYSQTSISEKVKSLGKQVKERYLLNEIERLIGTEEEVVKHIRSSGIGVRVFKDDQYSNNIDNIIQVLESE